jgi:hypothetical protein
VYAPSKINKKIHATAIHFVIMSVALLQFLMVVFSFIRQFALVKCLIFSDGIEREVSLVCSMYGGAYLLYFTGSVVKLKI